MRLTHNILVVAFLASGSLVGCKKKDVVNDVQPVSEALGGIRVTLSELAKLSFNERAVRLHRDWPHLERDLAHFLRRAGKIHTGDIITRVEYFFGSLDDAKAEDRFGVVHEGFFRDQLVARVHIRGDKPLDVIVQCLNSTFLLPGHFNRLQAVGVSDVVERFTVEAGNGLATYVDFPTAIALAERHNLPLYRGRIPQGNTITPREARALEAQTDQIQVTVYVVAGDTFDLRQGTFTPSPLRPPR